MGEMFRSFSNLICIPASLFGTHTRTLLIAREHSDYRGGLAEPVFVRADY